MFSRSYATSHAIEQQRLSSPATASLHSPPSLARAMRSIPDELRAIAPSSPNTLVDQPLFEEDEATLNMELDDEPLTAADAEDPPVEQPPEEPAVVVEHQEQEADSTLVLEAPVEPEEEPVVVDQQQPAPVQHDKPRPRSSFVARLLFPPSAFVSSPPMPCYRR